MSRNLILLFSTTVFFLSCTHPEKRFDNDIHAGRCDDALVHLPDRDPMVKMTKGTEQAAGRVASYMFIGASYTAEVLWDVGGGVVMVVGLCGPTLLAEAAGSGNSISTPPVQCLPGKINALSAPPLGRRATEKTRPLRCPDLASLSHSLRDVSTCYENRGGADNLKKALQNLEGLAASEDFYNCLPDTEKALVGTQIDHLKAKGVE